MGDGVTSAGNAPANQTTNASNSGAASPADAAQFGEALKQESLSLCPEGLRRPHKDDAPCTFLRNPSQPPQPSQPSQSVDPHQVQGDPDRFKSPITRSNGGDDYKKPTPKLEEKGVKVPDGPKVPSSMVPGDKSHLGGWGWPF